MTVPTSKAQELFEFFFSLGKNIYINKIAEHHLCAKSEHLSSPLNAAAQRNEAPELQGFLRKPPLIRPQSGSHEHPGSESFQDSQFAYESVYNIFAFKIAFKIFELNKMKAISQFR